MALNASVKIENHQTRKEEAEQGLEYHFEVEREMRMREPPICGQRYP